MGTDLRTPTSPKIVRTTEHKMKLFSSYIGAKCLPRALRFSTKQRIDGQESSTLKTVACKFGNLLLSMKSTSDHCKEYIEETRIIELASEVVAEVGFLYPFLR